MNCKAIKQYSLILSESEMIMINSSLTLLVKECIKNGDYLRAEVVADFRDEIEKIVNHE